MTKIGMDIIVEGYEDWLVADVAMPSEKLM